MADVLSIEQNNRIRVALGLKPLPVPGFTDGPVFKQTQTNDSNSSDEEQGSTLESRQAQGYDNWRKLQEEAEAKRKREVKNEAIKKARDAAWKQSRLEGKGLGEAEGGELDTKTWLIQQKKRQKKVEKERARKLVAELAERERMAEYTSGDLAGVRVGHAIGDFGDDSEQILTLKDATIDENEEEGDELENVKLRETEQLQERLELKKRKPMYDPNDADASGSILAHYDEEIDGKKRRRFVLDSKGFTAEDRATSRQDVSSKLKQQLVSLDISPEATPSDYLEPSEVKVKRPKKKKAKATRRRAVDEDDIFPTIETMDSPNGSQPNMKTDLDPTNNNNNTAARIQKRTTDDGSFVDDVDLQTSLAAQRKAAFKKRNKLRPEDIARQLREESAQALNEMDVDNNEVAEEAPGLIIDETSEFVANLQRPTLPDRQRRPLSDRADDLTARVTSPDENETSDVEMERPYSDLEGGEELKESAESEEPAVVDISSTGLQEESTLDQGIGATLAMLKQRGLVKTTVSGDLNALHRDRQRFLQEKHRREADAEKRARLQRERDRVSGKLDRMSARDREEYARWENKQRDQQESRQMADIFNREYKPDVQLKYVDEFGRLMNQKEAFKHLSHQFHGKGSGKMKTEKHLKKIDDEKKRESMSTLDSSQHTGMNNAMGATARRNRQAGVRLA